MWNEDKILPIKKLRNVFTIFNEKFIKIYLQMLKSAHYLISDERKKWARISARARLILHALPPAIVARERAVGAPLIWAALANALLIACGKCASSSNHIFSFSEVCKL